MADYEPSVGFATVEEEFEARCKKAFTTWTEDGQPPANYVVIYSKHQGFQIAMTEYCRKRGWLDDGELVELDSQSTEYRFRLTAAGKRHFGV